MCEICETVKVVVPVAKPWLVWAIAWLRGRFKRK